MSSPRRNPSSPRARRAGRPRQPRQSLVSAGAGLLFFGAVLLILPAMAPPKPVFQAMQAGLRMPGWLFLGLGALLVALHFALRSVANPRGAAQDDAAAPARSGPSAVAQGGAMARRGTPTAVPTEVGGNAAADAAAAHAPRHDDAAQRLPQAVAGKAITTAVVPDTDRPAAWSPRVFALIEWRRFEAVCEALFAQAGLQTRSQSHGADGGVDIWLHSRNASGPVAVVQCKHWQGKPVPVSAVREFFGTMAALGLKRGTYATSSTFTRDALAFAQANGINAQDGAGLLQLIASRTPEQQAELLAIAFEGDYWRPTCASCGLKMVPRSNSTTGEPFWSCSQFPRCRGSQAMTAAAKARLEASG